MKVLFIECSSHCISHFDFHLAISFEFWARTPFQFAAYGQMETNKQIEVQNETSSALKP